MVRHNDRRNVEPKYPDDTATPETTFQDGYERGVVAAMLSVMRVRDFLLLHQTATGRSDVNIRKLVNLLDDAMAKELPTPAKPDAGEGLDNVIERLAAKARKWRGQGWVSDAEWGAICAVLYVGEATDVTDADRKWAMGEIDRRATAEWPPTNEQVWAWYHSHPEWAEEDKRAKAEIDAGLRATTDETGGGKT